MNETAVHHGTRYAGSILAQSGRYIPFHAHGHRLGAFSTSREATRVVDQATRPGDGQ